MARTTYDAIVVGARCGGAATALLLARAGARVLLTDRTTFPSSTLSGAYIVPPGVAALKRWGLYEPLLAAAGCPLVDTWRFDVGPVAITGTPTPALTDGTSSACAPRRLVLDKLLVDAASAAGAEVREAFTVQQVLQEGERVVGVRGRLAGGASVDEHARVVVGADGMRSLVARSVAAAAYETHPTLTCGYYAHWADLPLEPSVTEIHARPGRSVLLFPVADGLTACYVTWPAAEFEQFRADVEGNFRASMAAIPAVAERLGNATLVGRIEGSGDLPNFARRPYGNGWALVGDAGWHTDPYLAQGMSNAFRDAELLSAGLLAAWSGEQSWDAAVTGYEATRNAERLPFYNLNCQLAAMEPPSAEMQHLFGALARHQRAANDFLGAVLGTLPVPRFFDPANLARIAAEALVSA